MNMNLESLKDMTMEPTDKPIVAVDFLNSHGLKFLFPRDFPNSYKIPADYFIDDANFGGFPGWKKVAEYFNIDLGENK
jgi:hypothetical protein